jgi:hypothetical protein
MNVDHPEWGVIAADAPSQNAAAEVYMGCMAQRGFLKAPGQP